MLHSSPLLTCGLVRSQALQVFHLPYSRQLVGAAILAAALTTGEIAVVP